MLHTSQARPALKFGPGYFIREQMELRGWTRRDLAEITGFTQTQIGELLTDKTPLGFDAACIFGEVFKTSAAYWLNLNHSYRLWLQR